MPRTEVHHETGVWVIRTTVRNTNLARTIAGARARPSDLRAIAEWTVPATVETAKQLKFTFPNAVWSDDARLMRSVYAMARKLRLGDQMEGEDPLAVGDKELAPFQVAGVQWLFNASGILADDMGLGKTVQACVAMDNMDFTADQPPHIFITCPMSALGVWEEHIKEWTHIEPFVFHGSARKKELAAFHYWEGAKALITTHGLVGKHSYRVNYGAIGREGVDGDFNQKWGLCVIDEAHKIGVDPGGKQVRAMKAVTQSSEVVWATTGTPVNDQPRDLWVLMSYVAPEVFGSYACFSDRYCIVRENQWDTENLGLHPDMEEEYEWIIAPWMLRRLKATHGPNIPKGLGPQIVRLPMTGPQARAYNMIVQESLALIDQESGRTLLIAPGNLPNQRALEYIAAGVPIVEDYKVVGLQHKNSNKCAYILEIAADRAGDPFVVYAWSRREIEMYARGLEEAGYTVGLITGKVTSRKERDATIKLFQAGGLDVLLLTDAGAEGITLTAADLIILARQSWRPLTNQQVADRIDRWGQTRVPQVQVLVSRETVDETRLLALGGKIELQEEMTLDKTRLRKILKGSAI